MVNVLILGANGQLARNTTRVFLRDTDAKLTLYLRCADCATRIPIASRSRKKGEPFKGHEVSLNSVSDLIVKLALTPGMEIRRSLGVSRG